jgi:hypothetical protein
MTLSFFVRNIPWIKTMCVSHSNLNCDKLLLILLIFCIIKYLMFSNKGTRHQVKKIEVGFLKV